MAAKKTGKTKSTSNSDVTMESLMSAGQEAVNTLATARKHALKASKLERPIRRMPFTNDGIDEIYAIISEVDLRDFQRLVTFLVPPEVKGGE